MSALIRRASWCFLVLLLLPSCGWAEAEPEILWDEWGVPHIYAENDEALFHAFGWAQMRSHGDLILRLYGQARGRAAEYWGDRSVPAPLLGEETFLESDRFVRTMGIPERAREWYAAQSPEARRQLDAFVAGMNAYAEAHETALSEDLRRALPIEPPDVLAHAQRAIHFTFVARPALPAAERWPQAAAGSNAYAIGPAHSQHGNAFLLANPHLPWSDLFLFYEAHLNLPDLNAYGATLVGMPTLAVGFNGALGWTHTVNTFDGADLYELTLTGDGSAYQWNGNARPLETTSDTLRVRQEDGSLREEELVIRRSVHGPVIQMQEDRALALRVAGLEQAGLFEQYWDMLNASSLETFEDAFSRLQIPTFNLLYADRAGNVLYVFGGRTPERSTGDWTHWQQPVRGDTSSTLWTATLPYERLPRVLNPPTGWVQNANDAPWTSTYPPVLSADDFPPYLAPQAMAPNGALFRLQQSIELIRAENSLTFDDLRRIKHDTRSALAERLLPDLLDAARTYGDTRARAAADVLDRWDRRADAESRGGVLFAAWFELVGPGVFATPWQPDAPLSTPRGLADPQAATRALTRAADRVEATYGALDVAWGEVHRFRMGERDLPGHGAGDPFGTYWSIWYRDDENGRRTAFGGDTFVALVEFGDPVRAEVLLSYGNATQPGSVHRGDQLELLAERNLRPALLTRDEVEAHLQEREVLRQTAAGAAANH